MILNVIEAFIAQYLSHHLKKRVPAFHGEILDALADKRETRLAIEAPRGFAKSTVAAIFYLLWEICEGDYEEIQLFSASGGTAGLATKWMSKIKKELSENQLLIHDFKIRRGKHWGTDHIEVIVGGRTVNFFSRGKNSAARGNRGLVVIDDPQGIRDVQSETILLHDEDWFFNDVLPILWPEQRLVFIGTAISPISLLSKVKKIPGWKVMEFTAEEPPGSGKSIWPDAFRDEELARRRAEMGVDRYNAEYLCRPLVSGNPVVREEWLRYYQARDFERIKRECIYLSTGFDGAEGKRAVNDHTGLVTLGATPGTKPDIYVLDVLRGQWSTKEGAEQVFNVFRAWSQHKTVVESRCKPPNVDAIVEEIQDRERLYGFGVNLEWFKPSVDKVVRLQSVQGIIQEGRVYFNAEDKMQQMLISELLMFTGNDTYSDDLVDAFGNALRDIRDWMTGIESRQTTGPTVVLPKGSRRPITGVI